MTIQVLVEISARSIDKVFTYLVPENLEEKIKVGVRVLVPFANLKLVGFVMEINSFIETNFELKSILEVIDSEVILTNELLELGKIIKENTLSTLISCYQVMLPNGYKASSKKKINKKYETYVLVNEEVLKNTKLTNKQQEVINFLNIRKNVTYKNLVKLYPVTKTLVQKNVLTRDQVEVYRLNNKVELKEKYPLTDLQQSVVSKVDLSMYNPYLLFGVTGSGKTEVYMELIEKVIKLGKTAIVLIPEISLTPQTVRRFGERFQDGIAILHSGLSDSEKYDEYRKIRKENIKIVIGARSAIFAPLENIGIIIVDEEHSTSYKQENMPRYDAIEVAKKRASYHNCPVVLGSATPRLESYARSLKGVYKLLVLDKRVNNRKLPRVKIIDLFKTQKKSKFISIPLYEKMIEVLEKGEQVILFLNKRGYASIVSCSLCGKTFTCPNCDITLTYHKTSDMLRCHFCGYAENKPNICPNCKEDSLVISGIGTEQVEEELNQLFPDYKTIRMDFDTTSKKGSHEKIINDFKDKKYQILLGTQMISKGLDFKDVTLVGVINADTSLNIPDFRSSETTFDLLNQVSGRSGRGDKEGMVYIQTFNPTHYAITYAKDNNYLGFFKEEMKNRKLLGYPPYYYLVLVRVKGKDYNILSLESKKIKEYLTNKLNFIVLGPSIANPFRVNSIYRFNLLIKYKNPINLYETLSELLDHYKTNTKVVIDIDFDPKNF